MSGWRGEGGEPAPDPARRPDRYDDRPPPGRSRPGDPRARRGPAEPRPDARWDADLGDPSELSGWRQRQAQARAEAAAASTWQARAPGRTPPTGRMPVADPTDPTVAPGPQRRFQPGTQVLDRGWQGPPPAAPDHDDARYRNRYGNQRPAASPYQDDDYGDDEHDDGADPRSGGRRFGAGRGRGRGARSDRTTGTAPDGEIGPRPELPYVAGFDGLRAVALLGVLAFHQGFEVARGGFLGISSFFTLSGFLVGTLALAEWAQNGRLAVPRTWEHRARRIVPALVFTVAVVVVLQTVLRVGAGPGYRGDVLAALGQVLNWRFALDGTGFASVLTNPSPVQHLWSVSLLAQVTVVLPLAFVGLMKLTGKRWRTAGAAFALAAAASFALAYLTAGRSGNDGMAYFGTHTRVGELLVGVVLAYAVLSPGVRRMMETPGGVRSVRYGTPIALLVLAWLWHSTSLYSSNLFGGVTAVNAVLTAWVVFAVTLPGPAATALGSLPLRTLGKISYAAYLLHWPIFLLLDDERIGVDGPLLFLARLGATLAAAAALTYGIERPFRTRVNLPGARLVLALGVSAAVVAAAVLVLPEQPPAGVTLSIGDGNGPGELDVVAPTGDEVASIALVGGSLAGGMPQGFEAWNEEHPDQQVRVHTHIGADCPLSGPGPVNLAGETIGEGTDCTGFTPRLPALLDQADADVVLVMPGVADLAQREIDRQWTHLGDPVFDDWLTQRLDELADTLERADVPVMWATALHVRVAPGGDHEGDWTDVADNDPARADRLNDIIRSVAAGRDGFTVVDLAAWAQRLPRGEFGTSTRVEGRDLSEEGSIRAAAWLTPRAFDVLGVGGDDAGSDAAGSDDAGSDAAEG